MYIRILSITDHFMVRIFAYILSWWSIFGYTRLFLMRLIREREKEKKIASPVQCRNWREITYHDSELRLRLEQALRTFGQVLTFSSSSSSSIRHGKPIIASFFFNNRCLKLSFKSFCSHWYYTNIFLIKWITFCFFSLEIQIVHRVFFLSLLLRLNISDHIRGRFVTSSYILTFFLFALCMLLKWAECQVRLHKRHTRLLMNYSLTIRYMYVYVRHPVCCRLLVYSTHKKKRWRWRKRSDFSMRDDNFSSCHFNSIKLLNVLVVIVKLSDNRFSFFYSSNTAGRKEKSQWTVLPTVMRYVRIVHYHHIE
jgi:hypothetical protein